MVSWGALLQGRASAGCRHDGSNRSGISGAPLSFKSSSGIPGADRVAGSFIFFTRPWAKGARLVAGNARNFVSAVPGKERRPSTRLLSRRAMPCHPKPRPHLGSCSFH